MSDPTGQPSKLGKQDISAQLHPFTNLASHEETGPLVITRGQGIHVYDENDKEYIEGMAGLWCTALGFGEEALIEAAAEQMRKLPYYHGFNGKASDTIIKLAQQLKAMAPVPMSKVFFANSGSEANDTVVKLVWYLNNARGRPEKKKIISRHKAYHGVTVASASLTGIPLNHVDFDLPLDRVRHTDCPHHYRFGEAGESEEDFATRLVGNLEKMIEEEGPETIAAFIAEPIMGAGGVILPPATYFEKVQAVLKKHDILFIADEVICGFHRTGNPWGSQTYGLHPDILVCAKALSSAYLPISAVMVSEEIYQTMKDASRKIGVFAHGFTYTGHPVAAAVALKNLQLMEERNIGAHARKLAPHFQAGLQRFADHPMVGEVRGVGLIGAIEMVKDKATKASFDGKERVGAYLVAKAEAHGLIVRALVDSIAFCPPLIITEAQIDEMMSRFEKALAETWDWVQKR